MEKRFIGILVALIIILAIVFAVAVSYQSEEDSKDKVILNASTEGPLTLESVVEDIKKYPYYEGYDNETLEWMESLGSKSVFYSTGSIIVMDSRDAGKLHSEYVTDAYIVQTFSCNIKENRTLLDANHTTRMWNICLRRFIICKELDLRALLIILLFLFFNYFLTIGSISHFSF